MHLEQAKQPSRLSPDPSHLKMKIAINTRFLLKDRLEGMGRFTYETVKRIVLAHPEHDFYFFFDRKYDAEFIFAKNVHPIVLFPPTRHVFLIYLWFEFAVHRALKKIKVEILLKDPSVKGFNIGSNVGKTAGQSILHCHIHLIPRREGDVENPQGGIRSVIPLKQHYKRKA